MSIIKRLVVLLCLACWFSPAIYADDTASIEYKIKAGYLYNFTKFISWSENPLETFNLCILGDDPFGNLIEPIEQRTAFDKPIKLVRLQTLNSKMDCRILFLRVPFSTVKNILASAEFNNTLTVGEEKDFIRHGGMIGFVNVEGRIKLQINLKNVKNSQLKISAKLLEVADIVEVDNHD